MKLFTFTSLLQRQQVLSDWLLVGKRPMLFAVAVITLATALFFGPILVQPDKIVFGIDVMGQAYFFEKYVSDVLRSGQLPYWNPYLFSGTIALSNPQYLVFYPPYLLLRFLPPHQTISWALALHVGLAGIGMYALCRRFKLHPWVSLSSGLTFMLSGLMILRVFLGHPWNAYAIAWMPLSWLLVIIALEDGDLLATIGAGVAIAMIILTGNPALPAYIFMFIGFYWLYFCLKLWSDTKNWRNLLISSSRFGFMFVLGLGLAAIQLAPSLTLSKYVSSGYSLEDANLYAITFFWFFELLVPGIREVPHLLISERSAYIGVLPLLATPFAFMRKSSRSFVWFLSLVSVFAIALAFGKTGGLYTLIYNLVPPFRILRVPPRALVMWLPAAIVLSGIGFQTLLEQGVNERYLKISSHLSFHFAALFMGTLIGLLLTRQLDAHDAVLPLFAGRYLWLGVILIILIMAGVGLFIHHLLRLPWWLLAFFFLLTGMFFGNQLFISYELHEFSGRVRSLGSASALLTLITLLLFFLQKYKASLAFMLLLIPIILVDLYIYDSPRITAVAPPDNSALQEYAAPLDLVETAERGRLEVRYPDTLLRKTDAFTLVIQQIAQPFFQENTFMVEQINTINGYDPVKLNDYSAFYSNHDPNNLDKRMLNFLNVTHFLTDKQLDYPGVEIITETPDYVLSRNLDALPRVFWVNDVQVVDSQAQALTAINDPNFAYEKTVILYDSVEVGTAPTAKPPTVTITGYNAPRGALTVETTTAQAGVLVFSEPYYIERRVWLDGEEVPVLKANIAFIAVALPAGTHIVELNYVPTSLYIGMAITGVTLFISLILVILGIRNRKNHHSTSRYRL